MAKMKFNPKDTKYKTLPKSASPKSPNEPDEYADHSYDHRETRPDGSVVYYYENGVKAIHHPKKTGALYHRRASKHHEKEATNAINAKDSSKALSHLKARCEEYSVEKNSKPLFLSSIIFLNFWPISFLNISGLEVGLGKLTTNIKSDALATPVLPNSDAKYSTLNAILDSYLFSTFSKHFLFSCLSKSLCW